MRGQQHVGQVTQTGMDLRLTLKHVQTGSGNIALLEGCCQVGQEVELYPR